MEISDKQKQKIAEVAKKYHLKLILLFGSRVDGKIHKESDYDIAVLGPQKKSFNQELKIIGEFCRIFGDNVDLTFLNGANPLLFFQVSKHCILLHGSREDFLNFRLRAFRLYDDYSPYFKLERSLNKKIINNFSS